MNLLDDLIDILLPRVCTVCHKPLVKGEDVMCLRCLAELPLTHLHRHQPNAIHERLASIRSRVERCGSMFFYNKLNPYSRLIISAKYHGRPSVARKLAEMYAPELLQAGFFDGIDLILPIPIHFTKLLTRGYNQSAYIAQGISKITGIPVADNLTARRPHVSQTRKGGHERREANKGIFTIKNPDELAGVHMLIVDDVITTGSTMSMALDTIHSACTGVKTSVLSLALTNS
ncbi:MAG: ComF family protein [Muribaculaceae bacterium]|nr:ComF family protein [Muribaculaceae bacterium]